MIWADQAVQGKKKQLDYLRVIDSVYIREDVWSNRGTSADSSVRSTYVDGGERATEQI